MNGVVEVYVALKNTITDNNVFVNTPITGYYEKEDAIRNYNSQRHYHGYRLFKASIPVNLIKDVEVGHCAITIPAHRGIMLRYQGIFTI